MKVYKAEDVQRVLRNECKSLDAKVNHYYREGIEKAAELIEDLPEYEAESVTDDE